MELVAEQPRELLDCDRTAVKLVDRKSFGTEAWSDSDWDVIINSPNVYSIVVEAAGRVVGFLVIELHPGRAAEVKSVTVEPLMRRKGYGAALLDKAVTDLPNESIEGYTYEDNLSTQLFLNSNGFWGKEDVVRSPFGSKTMIRFSRPAPLLLEFRK